MVESMKTVLRRASPGLALLALAAVAGWLAGGLWPSATETPALADDGWPPKISTNRSVEDEWEIGEVLVNNEPVIAFYAYTKKYTPYERAVIVAERIKLHMGPRNQLNVTTGLRDGSHCVLINDALIATPLADDLPEGMPLKEGAEAWADSLAYAFGIETVDPDDPEPWEPDEPYKDKFVPILSFGKGKRIGGARVNGPASAVAQTQAVVQIEAKMLKWFRVQVYVPVSTKIPGETIDRVQGVAVTAVGDLRL